MDMFNDRIKELENLILYHKNLYYIGKAEISDAEYDELEDELKQLDPNSPALRFVGHEVTGQKIKHDTPMLSLAKVRSLPDILSFSEGHECVVTYKMDGSSASLVYRNGVFELAKSRGDGVFGENLTKYFYHMDVPKDLSNVPENFEVRGEVLISSDNFALLSDEMERRELSKPLSIRNIVAGLLHRKDDLDLCKYLDFFAYGTPSELDLETESEVFKFLEKLGFKTPILFQAKSNDDFKNIISKYSEETVGYEYLTDGLVISLNSLEMQREKGSTAHHPKGKLAFKFKSESAVTTVREILVEVGRTGKVSFVGLVDPVKLSGATVSRVTLHNMKYIELHGINIGAEIEITRSGEVIPKHEKTLKQSGKYEFPKDCPVCSTELTISKTETDLLCLNPDCSAKGYGKVKNWVKVTGIEYLGDETLKKLYDNGTIKTVPDLYKLKITDIVALDKHGYKSAQNILDSIKKTKEIDILTFLAALGINGLGLSTAKLVTDIYNEKNEIFSLSENDLLQIKGIGEVLAKNIRNGILSYGKILHDELLELGVIITSAEKIVSSPISGKTIVITGSLSKPRKELSDLIEKNGGIVTSSVSKKTDYLLTNETSESTKYKKAQELFIPIITEEEFYKLLEP